MLSQFAAIPPLDECPTRETCPGPAESVSFFRSASNAAWSFTRSVNAILPNGTSTWPSWAPEGPISPMLVGADLLPVEVPPTLEGAFGYRGDLRFLQFKYSAGRRQFGYSDGGDDLASDESLWSGFLHHPVVTPQLPERRYTSSYGRFASETKNPALDQIMRSGFALPVCHCSHVGRRDRRAHVCQRDQKR